MKVADIMQREVDYVTVNTTVKDVSRIIFGRAINGLPVVEGRKLVGFITERDIVSQFFPTVSEYIEDPFHASDFEEMEKKTNEILSLTAESVMSKTLHVVAEDTPVLKAQSLMFVNKIGRLPVVDSSGNLIGIVSKGDIFEAVIQQKLPLHEEEGFYDWLARYYDSIINWKKRLGGEIPDLVALFRREKVKKVLDIASGTGEHVLTLAKRGFTTYGIEASGIMSDTATGKRAKLPPEIGKKASFLRGKYKDVMGSLPNDFDAVLFMGNSLPHVLYGDRKILQEAKTVMKPKKSILVLQIANIARFYRQQQGLREFAQRFPTKNQGTLSISFYSNRSGKTITYTRTIFDFNRNKWVFRTSNSIPTFYLEKQHISTILRKAGFSDIEYYGGELDGRLFKLPFNPSESYWLNIIARK